MNKTAVYSAIIILIFGLGGSFLFLQEYKNQKDLAQDELSKAQQEFMDKLKANGLKHEEQREIIALLEKNLEEEKESYDDLEDDFKDLEKQIRKITKSVGTLEKLQFTDPELLAKYSKVFFLNEHYVPEKISSVDTDYLYNKDSGITVSSQILPFLNDMMEEALDDDIELLILSGYRSFNKQKSIKESYVHSHGQEAADTFSADQGLSEHQLGTTVDFTTRANGANLGNFVNTEHFTWLQENSHKYGFVLSYPEDNQFYKFEPWHWRFVGKDLAKDLYKDEEFLYDVPQRRLDEYLPDIFDN